MIQRIQLLPDSVANQIAAGEVIQRPASVIKELVENAIDAKASKVQVIIKDAGKTLIQIVDNGIGMSQMDARMAFERHATSKISEAKDLFTLHTKGFRGEALASIAAISHVTLKTRTEEEEVGTQVKIEGSKVVNQEACQTPVGSDFSIKNLFYNVPARRKFLKSDPVELKHIIEEFTRVVIAHPECSFQFFHNDQELYNLPVTNFRQRIVKTMGGNYNDRLVPVEEDTDIVNIKGFIGKPEYARKTRGEQYLFVNNRFIKSGYFHHSINRAYSSIISKEQHPSYYLYFKVDPDLVDVNIHPSKTEVKFRDEKAIYAILHATIRRSIGQYNISPSLDFEKEVTMMVPELKKGEAIRIPQIQIDPSYDPFKTGNKDFDTSVQTRPAKQDTQGWEEMYKINKMVVPDEQKGLEIQESPAFKGIQVHRKYIFASIRSGFVFIDQQRAHERILYEKYLGELDAKKGTSQKELFPDTIDLNSADHALVEAHLEEFNTVGLELELFGPNSFKINALPAGIDGQSAKTILEKCIEEIKLHDQIKDISFNEKLAISLARSHGLKSGVELTNEEMQDLIEELFSCQMPYHSPSGLPVIINFSMEELDQKFKK